MVRLSEVTTVLSKSICNQKHSGKKD